MPAVFISYKRGHEPTAAFVRRLEKELGSEVELLRDERTLKPGDTWSKELYRSLLECDAGVAIVSSEANTSDWCRREWSVLAARNQVAGLPVFPVQLDDLIVTTGILDHLQALKRGDEAIALLRQALSRLPQRTRGASDFLALHQAWLRWQYRENPVLSKEPYALADVYIDTECGQVEWGEIHDGRGGNKADSADPFKEANGGRVDLLSAVTQRIVDPNFRDLIVVQAGPGSGKSAFTLRLANRLMDDGFTPILVRFRDLRLATFPDVGELIDDAIRIGHADDDSPIPSDPVVAEVLRTTHKVGEATLCRAVFILDGWDEVSLTGNVVYQAQLQKWLPKLREYFTNRRGDAVRVVLTGRPSAEVGQSGVLHKTTPVLTMRPVRPEQLRAYATAIKTCLDASPAAAWAIDLNRLEPAFAAYDRWFADFLADKDQGRASAEVLGNPLLAYLSLRVLAASSVPPQDLLDKPTALYHELIDATVRHAGKGQDAGLPGAVHRGGEALRRLLHEVASTISIFRAESVSFEELEARFKEPGLPLPRDLLKDWTSTIEVDSALRELVVNFYFKGGNRALGCEFLHKSFREYLFAEAIVFALKDASALPPVHSVYEALEFWRDFPENTPAHWLSRRLAYLLAPQWLSPEVDLHVRWLVQREAGAQPERWQMIRDLVTEVYAWWAEGVHLRHQPTGGRNNPFRPPFVDELCLQTIALDHAARVVPPRTTVFDAHLGLPLLQLAALLHERLANGEQARAGRRARYQSKDGDRVRFQPFPRGFAGALVSRIDAAGWRREAGLAGVVLRSCHFRELDLRGVLLNGVDLSWSDLGGAFLDDANLHWANLEGADLGQAHMVGANLGGASLRGANLTGCVLLLADLQMANLVGANLARAELFGADLSGADLSGADLTWADLVGARLSGIVVQGANLDGARISRRAGPFKGAPVGTPTYIADGPAAASDTSDRSDP